MGGQCIQCLYEKLGRILSKIVLFFLHFCPVYLSLNVTGGGYFGFFVNTAYIGLCSKRKYPFKISQIEIIRHKIEWRGKVAEFKKSVKCQCKLMMLLK